MNINSIVNIVSWFIYGEKVKFYLAADEHVGKILVKTDEINIRLIVSKK